MFTKYQRENWLRDTLEHNGAGLPHTLYKFASPSSKHFSKNAKELLLRNRLRLSSRVSFNDPFDTRPHFLEPKNAEGVAAFWTTMRSRFPDGVIPDELVNSHVAKPEALCAYVNERVEPSLDQVGICSMTARIDHPLMWAHYGESYAGVAWIFAHALEKLDFGALPVRYQREYPTVELNDEGLDGIEFAMLVKGDAWRYEDEWRVARSHAANSWHQLDSNALRGVVFGPLTLPGHIQSVVDLETRRRMRGLRPLRMFGCMFKPGAFEFDYFRLEADRTMTPVDLPLAYESLVEADQDEPNTART